MSKIAIIIPSRLDAVRLPNKPLELINNKEMMLGTWQGLYLIEHRYSKYKRKIILSYIGE